MKRKIITLIALSFVFVNVFSQKSTTLSIKGRWNINAGYSSYKVITTRDNILKEMLDIDNSEMFDRKPNVRIEANYGVLKWLEVGVYAGFSVYQYPMHLEDLLIREENDDMEPYKYKNAFFPTFGVNANIQLLPLWVKNPKCKWDFYIPIRYGGCYLTRWGGVYPIENQSTGTWEDAMPDPNGNPDYYKQYRHEYGAGFGGAYYIKNIIGFYAEVLGGQFSYYPELVKSPYAIRVGITAKF
ncbi:MAG: hypothetical protein LBS50_10890 [Prevotellaceae bacterium]|jgi:hypothetical protein|nr:hypothetical protein [Prevotellaceae bacterium]